MIYTPMTIKAMNIAYKAHQGQMDKNKVPYIFHPIHVAEQMKDEITCTAALLHDVVEDTDMTLEDLAKEFPAEVVDIVRCLTHEENVAYLDYLQLVKTNPKAVLVKLADLDHNADETRYNTGDPMDEAVILRRRKKYENAYRILREE